VNHRRFLQMPVFRVLSLASARASGNLLWKVPFRREKEWRPKLTAKNRRPLQLQLIDVLSNAPFEEAIPAVSEVLVFLLTRHCDDPTAALNCLVAAMERLVPGVQSGRKNQGGGITSSCSSQANVIPFNRA
jgi:hypothetical protein